MQTIEEEVRVLEVPKRPEVEAQRRDEQRALAPRIVGRGNGGGQLKIDRGRRDHET
jgi:hypothetical protein